MKRLVYGFAVFLVSLFLVSMVLQPVQAAMFNDVSADHPFHSAILELVATGAVQGYSDGSFRPDQKVNRVEFLKMTIEASGQGRSISNVSADALNDELSLSDLEFQAWYLPYVDYALQQKIVSGYPDGTFKPTDGVNLVEALKMGVTTLGLSEGSKRDPWYARYTSLLGATFEASTGLSLDADLDTDLNRGQVAAVLSALAQLKLERDIHQEAMRTTRDESQATDDFTGVMAPESIFTDSSDDDSEVPEDGVPSEETLAVEIQEPVLLIQRSFLNGSHEIDGFITLYGECNKLRTTGKTIVDSFGTNGIEISLEKGEGLYFPSCQTESYEHHVKLTISSGKDATIQKLSYLDRDIEFRVHQVHREVMHPQAPLELVVQTSSEGQISLSGSLPGGVGCLASDDLEVLTYEGATTRTFVDFTTDQSSSCDAVNGVRSFSIPVEATSELYFAINGEPISAEYVVADPELDEVIDTFYRRR